MNKKIKVFLLACVLVIMCCIGFTVGAADEAKAEVKGHSLTITEAGISVNFYVDIQGDVSVTLNEEKVDVPTETKTIILDAKAYDCYVFTQPVVAKEMDDKVTLSIFSGEEELVRDSYCVNDYVSQVQEGGYGYNFENLANAMTYYGEFAEVYFGYNGATNTSANASSYIADITEAQFEEYAMSVNKANMPEGLSYYATQLNLNSEITLRLLFKVEGVAASSYGKFTADGMELGKLKQSGEYYYVDIEGIGADKLGKGYTIKCGDVEIISNCSVLTYARAVVKNSTKESLVNLAKSLYMYNQKAVTYVVKPATDVKDIFYNGTGFYAEPECTNKVYLTANNEVTKASEGNTEITTLSQLSDSRTKGCSVWMKAAYAVSGTEELTGPYVIRRYEGNTGNVLNVTGTATLETTVNGNAGAYVAQYPGGTVNVTLGEVESGEVAVSGALNVTGNAKAGVITVASNATANINVDGLTEDGQVVLASHKDVNLSGNAALSAITLLDDGDEHFGIVKYNDSVRVASIVCVCGETLGVEDVTHSCAWTGTEKTIEDVYNIAWQEYTVKEGKLPGESTAAGYYYLANNLTLTGRTEVAVETYVDLNGKIVTGVNSRNIGLKLADYAITDSKGGASIKLPDGYNYQSAFGGMITTMGAYTMTIYGGCIDMSAASTVPADPSNASNEYHLIDLASGGMLVMHGGTIIPAQDGKGFGIRNGHVMATGGTIYGEIVSRSSSTNTITVGDGAEVGVTGKDGDWLSKIANSGIDAWISTKVNCDNLNEDAQIVLASKSNITLDEIEGSDSSESAVTLLDDGMGHFGVVKQNGKLRLASVICACGEDVTGQDSHICPWTDNVEGIANVYDINWQAYVDNGYMPGYNTPGYYYLTKNITLTQKTSITSTGSHLDLSGKKITLAKMSAVCIAMPSATAKYAISDSDSNANGAIQLAEDFTSAYYGGVLLLNYSGSFFTMYGGTIDMSNGEVSADIRTPIELGGQNSNGGLNFTMYGGEIIPTKDGRSLYVHENANVSILGDAIVRGEINLTGSWGSLKFSVGDSAKVGLQYKTFEKYGIVPHASAGRQITCSNLNENADIVIKSKANLSLSEKSGSNSLASVFTVVNEGKDGHYGVVKKSDGTLAFGTVICVCGKNVSDTPTHTCAWVNAQTNKINDVYSISWQEYTATTGTLPGTSTAGYYYLTDNFTASRSDVTVESYLDLNGYTVTTASSAYWTIRLETSSSSYTITDSKGKGTMQFSENYIPAAWGSMVLLNNAGKFTMYGGTIDMTNASESPYTPIDVNSSQFFMYGGVIKPVQSKTGNSNSIGTRNSGTINVMGGTIYGDVILSTASGRLNVGNDAKVGLQFEDNASYGISAWQADGTLTPMTCENVRGSETIILNTPQRMAFTGTGEASALKLTGGQNDGHFGVVTKADETLALDDKICVCGADISNAATTHNCAWVAANGIDAVYALDWQAYDGTSGKMPGYDQSGNYYLANNFTLTAQTDITLTTHLDLNGKTITGRAGRNLHIKAADIEYSIADSKTGGKMQLPEGYSYTAGNGGMIWADYAGTFSLYGGTIDMSRTETGGDYNLIDVASSTGAKFHMYGGEIIGAQDGDCIGVRQLGTVVVTGGIIRGEITLAGTANTITIGKNAQVALPVSENSRYGITPWTDQTPIYIDNVTADAKIYLNMVTRMSLSGTGEASAFVVMDEEYVVVNTAEGLSIQKKNSGE